MEEVNIYIESSIRGPRKADGGYMYILECIRDGKAVTLEKHEWVGQATENRLCLMALSASLKRLNCPCQLKIHTSCEHIINAMQNNWVRQWQKKGWVNAKGNRVKNHELWEEVLSLLDRHLYTFDCGYHVYRNWMLEQLEKETEKHCFIE